MNQDVAVKAVVISPNQAGMFLGQHWRVVDEPSAQGFIEIAHVTCIEQGAVTDLIFLRSRRAFGYIDGCTHNGFIGC